jgi:hypothetical protein
MTSRNILVSQEGTRFSRKPILDDQGRITGTKIVVTEYYPQENPPDSKDQAPGLSE